MNTRPIISSLLFLAVACGGTDDDPSGLDGGSASDGSTMLDGSTVFDGGIASTPTILSNTPLNSATDVALNGNVTVTFSEAMDRATITRSTFTLSAGQPPVAVLGTVIYSGSRAVFWPSVHLARDTRFFAKVSTGAKSAAGVALAASHEWSFNTGNAIAARLPVDLGAANDFVILAKSGISTVPTSAITGNLGVSPAAATFITGFSLIAHSTNVYATSDQVTGRVFAADYALPTPSNLTTSVLDMELAFTDAAGRAPDVTELGAGNIGGMTLEAKVYKWGTGLLIPSNLTLNGSATDVWIFQVAGDLTIESAVNITLSGGAVAKNVYWQVAGSVEIGTTAHVEGVILTQTSIALRTGASITGRLLAQTAVTIDSSAVVQPAR